MQTFSDTGELCCGVEVRCTAIAIESFCEPRNDTTQSFTQYALVVTEIAEFLEERSYLGHEKSILVLPLESYLVGVS